MGKIPQDQPKGIFHLVGRNLKSASTKEVRDRKISDIHWLLETWDIKGGGFSEIGVDWRKIPQRKRLDSWFCTSRDEYQTSASHNCQEEITGTTRQQGGIAIFAGKELRQYILRGVGNLRRLGRWNLWIIQSDPSHRTRMVVAYQVGQAHQKGLRTIYQQHMRYIQANGLSCTPRSLFQADILHAVGRWLEYGDRIIIFIDMNKHIIMGTLPKAFQRLGLLEATHLNWEGTKPSTFVFGKGKPIDGVFHSPELEIMAVMQLSFHEGVGDHKTTIIDITTRSIIGKFERRVVTPQSRRLSTRKEKSMKEYIKWTTQQCRLHKLQSRIDKVAASVSLGEALPMHINKME